MVLRLPSDALVITVGAPASGKSTWARANFRAEQIVSSDQLRGVVGQTPTDQLASKDMFEVLDLMVAARMKRGLLTVVDSTHLEARRRGPVIAMAKKHGRPVVAVVFDVDVGELIDRNRTRDNPVPQRVIRTMAGQVAEVCEGLAAEGVDEVIDGAALVTSTEPALAETSVVVVPPEFVDSPASIERQSRTPAGLEFGLSIPRFDWVEPEHLGPALVAVVRAAEEVGFTSLWVMDHLIQIPSMGRAWDPMLEGWTTISHLAGATDTIDLGLLVGAVTLRNPALLGKMVATLDVLSGGRARCGLGAAWYEREHAAYGIDFPPLSDRYALLEDVLELLPVLWGPGTKPWQGRTIQLAETTCYPRPLQHPHPPILVGGLGERRTLRLVAKYAQACNLPGGAEVVRQKLEVLHAHCADMGRDPDEIEVTQLGDVVVADTRDDVAATVERLRPGDVAPATWAARVNAGTVDDHVGRFRVLADAGVDTAIVGFPDMRGPDTVRAFADVIAAFAPHVRQR